MAEDGAELRADARANRERIIEVAREALAADPGTSLNAIVKAAGLGAGTLYRHFPTREALLVGVYRKEVDALAELAPTLLATHRPLDAFWLWCRRLAEASRMKHGVADLIRAAISDQDLHETYLSMVGAVRSLTDACESSGDIRPGADPGDVLTLLSVLGQIPPDPDGTARAQRLTALVLRGLGAESPELGGLLHG